MGPEPLRRETRQRAAIAELLEGGDRFRSALEIYEDLIESGRRVGLTTVYRTLQRLAAAGEVDVIVADSGEALYRRCQVVDHHHHLVCRGCGLSVEIQSPEVETWAEKEARKHRFTDFSHKVELYGLCRHCS